jgi:DNA invertase Pin-like site-specific DNA recombinase
MTDTKQTLAIADATAAPRSGRLPAAQDSGPSDTPVRNGHLIGYARVSTRAQDLALQLDALEHDGCERVYQDVGSGSIRSRPQLDACLEHLLPGDTLVVWRLDRLGRSLRHLIDVIADLKQREIAFRSLRESIDTTTATGRLQLHLFAALAEFERELIRERSTAGRDAARARGRQGGRPSVITPELLAAATAMRDKRELTMAQIARTLKIGRSTLYKHLDINHETNTEHDLAA